MTSSNWIPLVAGAVVTTLAVVGFLLALRRGLKQGKWLPLIIITSLWLLGMVMYAFTVSQNLENSPRQRIGAER